jgi:hypothetical protein
MQAAQRAVIREARRLYAGDLDVALPYVSPLNGDFRGAGADDRVLRYARSSLSRQRPPRRKGSRGGRTGRSSRAKGPAAQFMQGCRRRKAAKHVRSSCALLRRRYGHSAKEKWRTQRMPTSDAQIRRFNT